MIEKREQNISQLFRFNNFFGFCWFCSAQISWILFNKTMEPKKVLTLSLKPNVNELTVAYKHIKTSTETVKAIACIIIIVGSSKYNILHFMDIYVRTLPCDWPMTIVITDSSGFGSMRILGGHFLFVKCKFPFVKCLWTMSCASTANFCIWIWIQRPIDGSCGICYLISYICP